MNGDLLYGYCLLHFDSDFNNSSYYTKNKSGETFEKIIDDYFTKSEDQLDIAFEQFISLLEDIGVDKEDIEIVGNGSTAQLRGSNSKSVYLSIDIDKYQAKKIMDFCLSA